MPKVTAYSLPTDSLQAIAAGSGLQWVNSSSERVQAVQAAIAAEPKPAHVPRERAPAVALDDRPLVLVETRKDLRNLTLPFEQDATA
jgi:ribonuclease E